MGASMYPFARLVCWLMGHRWVEDPGLERDGVYLGPLYYSGFRPYCERCNKQMR